MFDRNIMQLPGMHGIMGALLVLALLQAACIAGQAFALSACISQLWGGSPVSAASAYIAAFAACFALLHLLRFAQETMLDRYSTARAGELEGRLLESVFDARSLLAARVGSAHVATTVTEGIDDVQTYIRIMPPKIVGMAAISIPLLVVAFATDWVSGIILAVMFPVIIFFMILLGRQASDRAKRQYESYTLLSNRFMDTLRGLPNIKALGAQDEEGRQVHSFSEQLRKATVRTLTTATLSSAVLDLCATFGVAAVAMMLAFRLMDGSVSLQTALFALVLAPEYFAPIRSFASDFHASLDGKNALADVLGMLERQSGEDEAANGPQNPIAPWGHDSVLELRDVTFSHVDRNADADVGPISLALSGFEKVALVGKSGAGKSTLVGLLAGFYEPRSGSVAIDGHEVSLGSPSWKEQVRYVPQSPYVFNATLLDNLRFYEPEASLDQVRAAVRAVGLESFVDSLPEGLDTVVGEGARGLSGGQAHRIALARILLDAQAKVLLFDEPTAHLDIETEYELKQRMLPLMEGKLVVFATHRLHWTESMERTVTLDDGLIVSDRPGQAMAPKAASAADSQSADDARADGDEGKGMWR